jgi:alpha/beta superfamily hydrolase
MGRMPLPGPRGAVASLDDPTDAASPGGRACVVACPPHPQQGGTRQDPRLRAASAGLAGEGIACLRIDYGAWDDGFGEVTDAEAALRWAVERYDRVGLFGYSFGAGIALVSARDDEPPLIGVSLLAPPSTAETGEELTDTLEGIEWPIQILVGDADETVDHRELATRAAGLGAVVHAFPTDHYFGGVQDRIADRVGSFFAAQFDD